jgi:rifampin ADP-ribosylating transferase
MSVFFHGTRAVYAAGDLLQAEHGVVWVTDNLDAAIWAAELADGDEPPHVYEVEVDGLTRDHADDADFERPPYPSMTLQTQGAVKVRQEITQWRHYHGTKAQLAIGDLIAPGHAANFGPTPRTSNFVYFTRTLDAAIWGAELAAGAGPERIFVVEPTGAVEDDPNLTNTRFKGNPSKSFRSRFPLQIVDELETWNGHPLALVEAMKAAQAKRDSDGVEPNDN